MAIPGPTKEKLQQVINYWLSLGGPAKCSQRELGRRLKMSATSIQQWLTEFAPRHGLKVPSRAEVPLNIPVEEPLIEPDIDLDGELPDNDFSDLLAQVKATLKKGSWSLDDLAKTFSISRGKALDAVDTLKDAGVNISGSGDVYFIPATTMTGEQLGRSFEYKSRANNTYLFGAIGDSHLCSKYERLDVLNDLYDRFAALGVDRVFHAGNWIDGECNFNQHDIHTHGLNNQLAYLAREYPRRAGIKTYAIAGEDHEGWYSRRESIDIGKQAARAFTDANRDDWVDIGFMEAAIDLVNANTGKSCRLVVSHPGGGSAYAVSYRPQKIVESLEGGEKPAILLIGHYHKLSVNLIRNVWTAQVGATQDQTPFMRKKNIDSHIGGMLIQVEQDPDTGAIISFTPRIYRYFNKAYYNDRWARDGAVVLPERNVA